MGGRVSDRTTFVGYYLCRFCDVWQGEDRFSADQIRLYGIDGRRRKTNPICKKCARFGTQDKSQAKCDTARAPDYVSLSLESRYAVISVFSGDSYTWDDVDVPALPVEVLQRIFA